MTAFCFEICCIGYGFDASNIKKKEWINLIKKYNPAQYEQIKKEVAITNKTVYERVSDEMISADIFEYLNELNALSPANYLASLINDGETETAGTNYLFSDINSFLIFESVRFSDEARAQYIKKMFKISGMLYPDILTSRVCMEAMYSSMSLKTTYGSILPDDMTLTRQLLSCRFLWTVPMLNVILCSACEIILRIKTISTTHREAKGGKHERCYCKKENPQTIRQRADIHDR